MTNINSLISTINEYARPNRFQVSIFPPNVLINGSLDKLGYFEDLLKSFNDTVASYLTGEQDYGDQRAINLSCSAISMPGMSYATKDMRTGSGPLTKVPYDKIFEPITATFYLDIEYNNRRMFLDWMEIINSPEGTKVSNSNHYEFYENYIGGMYIEQMDMNGLPSHVIYLEEMYPTAIGEVALGYENGDAVSTFTVTFTYRDFVQKHVNRLASTILDNI